MSSSGSAALRYHSATKYDPATIGQLPAADFGSQPVPFKQYHSERAVELIPYLPPELFPDADPVPEGVDTAGLLGRLSRLLYFSLLSSFSLETHRIHMSYLTTNCTPHIFIPFRTIT